MKHHQSKVSFVNGANVQLFFNLKSILSNHSRKFSMSMDKIPTFESLIGISMPREKEENQIFANTEVKKVLGWSKSPDQKLKIWQRTDKKDEDRDISIRNKISEIKQNVRERNSELVNKNSIFVNDASR